MRTLNFERSFRRAPKSLYYSCDSPSTSWSIATGCRPVKNCCYDRTLAFVFHVERRAAESGRIRSPLRLTGAHPTPAQIAHIAHWNSPTSTGANSFAWPSTTESSRSPRTISSNTAANLPGNPRRSLRSFTTLTCAAACGSPPNWRACNSTSSAAVARHPVQRAGAGAIRLRRSGSAQFLRSRPADFSRRLSSGRNKR